MSRRKEDWGTDELSLEKRDERLRNPGIYS